MSHTHTVLLTVHSEGGAKPAHYGSHLINEFSVCLEVFYVFQGQVFQFVTFPLGTSHFLATTGFYINLCTSNIIFTSPHPPSIFEDARYLCFQLLASIASFYQNSCQYFQKGAYICTRHSPLMIKTTTTLFSPCFFCIFPFSVQSCIEGTRK